jgi:threonine dehydratase
VSAGVTLAQIEQARARIAAQVGPTPLRPSPSLTDLCRGPVWLKCETRQVTGSFKLRGATNAVLSLGEDERRRGLVTASTGNHGRALALAARQAGVRAVICMSALVPANKVEAVRALGAEARITGRSQDDAQIEVARLVREEGLTEIPPFDHGAVIAGQGTVGLEVVETLPKLDCVLVPLSGGGLASGVAAAVKGRRPGTRVIGVSMARGAAMHASLRAGRPVAVEELETLADSLGGGIGLDNDITFSMCRSLLDGVVLLSEDEIAAGIRHAHDEEGEMVEGAGAVGIAALLAHKVTVRGPTVAILSGRNIDPGLHQNLLHAGHCPSSDAEVA